jgi:ribosomal protein S18 acetylase RimI-like enzyme
MTETLTEMNDEDSKAVVIERASPGDAEAISDLLRRTWQATYPNEEAGITEDDIRLRTEGENGERIPQNTERWRKHIEANDDNSAVFVARTNGVITGMANGTIKEGKRYLTALYVSPEEQGQGIGGKLMRNVLDWHGEAEDIYLNVASYNQNAIDFYKRYGFEQTDTPVVDEGNVYGNTRIPEIEMVRRTESE